MKWFVKQCGHGRKLCHLINYSILKIAVIPHGSHNKNLWRKFREDVMINKGGGNVYLLKIKPVL